MRIVIYPLTLLLLLFSSVSFSQRGKDGPRTVNAANTILNEYTALTADAGTGATTLTVAASGLNFNGRFSGNLAAGDLVMIIQMQGANINGVLNVVYGVPNDITWGAVTNYNNCGNYEYAEVAGVPNGTTITLTCGLRNSYTSAGRVQVVRIPRFTTLTLNSPGTITGQAWNGTTGGIVATETSTSTTINAGASYNGNAIGFRGGACTENNSFLGASYFSATNDGEGAPKGEGIAGFGADYTPYGGQYGMGSPANAGGGGTSHNSGGGGGANGGVIASWTGNGTPDPNVAYNNAWNLEFAGFAGSTSTGGGKGGYSFSNSNQNAGTTGPGNAAWGGDNRRVRGGYGGRPLDYTTGKIFLGGGGGGGDMNDGDGGPGGRGGGIVFIISHGTVGGTGSITANGQNGTNSDNSSPPLTGYSGIDGAGGAGGGGAVIINSNNTISGISVTANGGTGGNQNFANGGLASPTYNPAYGPGGGGGGGYIAISNGAITRTANGGNNGTTNSSGLTEFPPNGATRGGTGTNNAAIANYSIDVPVDTITICGGGTATFTAVVTGTLPGGTTIVWYNSQFGSTSVGTGTTFTTPPLASTTTYYVGLCPGFYRIPVTVIVSPAITINTTNMVITNETCAGNDGSITGITVSGGTNPLTYLWNGSPTAGPNLTGAVAGSYTLVVNDGAGCSASAGPFTINSSGGPVINTSGMVITNTTCGNNNGSITGITATGSGSLTYQWNGTGSPVDITNQPAGSYTLTVTDGIGCTSTAGPFTIGSSSSPSINTSGMTITNTSCGNNNGSITGITASGGSGSLTYQWNGVGSPLNITNQPAGSYTLVVTDAAGCTATAGPFTINSSSAPSINTSGMVITDAACGGNNGSITGITASGGSGSLTYQWNGTGTPSADLSNQPAGSYTLVVTDGAGCTATAGPFVINTTTGPSVNTTAMVITNTSCGNNNGSITGITVSGGTGPLAYEWNNNPSASPDLNNQPAGSYTFEVTDSLGCTATAGPFTINPSSAPSIDTSGMIVTNATCGSSNGSITGITVTGGSGGNVYTWNGNPSTLDISGLATGGYTLQVTDNSGCTDTFGPVNINAAGGATIDDSGMILTSTSCGNNNGSITGINVSGGTNPLTIEWNGSVSGVDISGLSPGSYTLQVTDGAGCVTISGPYTINSSTVPSLSINGTDATCNGMNDGSAVANATSGISPYSYQWTGGPSTTVYANLVAGTYTCIVTDNAGCTDTATVTISEPPPMNTSVSGTTTICQGQSTTLTASGGSVFNWNTSDTTAVITVAPASTTTYTVIISNNPCSDTLNVTVTVNNVPVALITGDTTVCPGQSTTLTASGGTSFIWSNGATTSSITISPSSDTTYTVSVSNGCGADTSGINVIVNTPPVADAGPDVTIPIGSSTVLNGNGGINYSWSPSAGLSCTNCQSPVAGPTTTTTYTMTITDANGCTASDDVTVIVDGTFSLFVPDAFSPNNDSNNDILFVRGSGIEQFEFKLYDRWGQLIFTTTDQQTGWNGTFKGEELNSAVFIYTLEGNYFGGETFSLKGNITLYR